MQYRKALIVGGSLLAVVGIIAYFARPNPVPVDAVSVTRGSVAETVTNTRAGTIKACERARLAPTMGGTIERLPVKKGDHVTKGQLLLELWNRDLRAQLTLVERDAVAADARAEQACIAAKVARQEAARIASLFASNLVSADAADKAKGDAEQTDAACRAATQDAKVSRARIEQAQASLERTRLRAPFDGIVAEINGEIGEFVTPSPIGIATPPAVDVVDTSCIYITAPIDEVDAPRIREGMRARVTLDAFKDMFFPAHVRRVAPYVLELEKQARTVEVEAELESHEGMDLLPGYSADLEVIIDQRENALRIPTRALVQSESVYVVEAGEAHLRKVTKGLANWEFTEVLDGLKEGDMVITSIDREGLADGVRVEVAGQ